MRAVERRGVSIGALVMLGLSAVLSAIGADPVVMGTAFLSIAILVALLADRLGHGRDALRARTTGFALVTALVAMIGLQQTLADGRGSGLSASIYVAIAITALAAASLSGRSQLAADR
jgi:hypothetical protein